MSNKKSIEESLKRLILDDDKEFVAMLSGEWGIGKTYFWREEFSTKKELTNSKKSITYISLYGYSSIQSIKNDIVLKLSKAETTKAVFSEVFQSFRTSLGSKDGDESTNLNLSGSLVSSALSLIPEKSLKDSIVCFDDFERLSDKVSFKDVLGLISQFKEQKKCKVIMILNEGELSEDNQNILSKNKEKIVDYSFNYLPSQEELFEAIKEDIVKIKFCKHQTIYDFFTKITLNNIRIMKQAVYQLGHFNFIKSKSYNEQTVNEFVQITLNLFVWKSKTNYGYKDLKYFRAFINSIKNKRDTKQEITEEKVSKEIKYNEILKDYALLGFIYRMDDIESSTYTYIDTNNIDKDNINRILANKDEHLDFNNIYANITKINYEYTHSFSTTDNDTSKKLKQKLLEHKDEIHSIFTYYEFNWFITNLKEYGGIFLSFDDIKLIIQNYIKFYINNPNRNEKDFHTRVSNLDKLLEDYPSMNDYKNTYLSKDIKKDIELLPKIIANIRNEYIYSDENKRHLELYSIEDFKESIINAEPIYIDHIVQVCTWSISGNDFTPIKSKISSALAEISTMNDEFKRKVESITKHAELTLKEKE